MDKKGKKTKLISKKQTATRLKVVLMLGSIGLIFLGSGFFVWSVFKQIKEQLSSINPIGGRHLAYKVADPVLSYPSAFLDSGAEYARDEILVKFKKNFRGDPAAKLRLLLSKKAAYMKPEGSDILPYLPNMPSILPKGIIGTNSNLSDNAPLENMSRSLDGASVSESEKYAPISGFRDVSRLLPNDSIVSRSELNSFATRNFPKKRLTELSRLGVSIENALKAQESLSRWRVVRLTKETDPLVVAQNLSLDPDIEAAEPNFIYTIQSATGQVPPNDPYYYSKGSWKQPFDDLWGLKAIDGEAAWRIEQGSPEIVVAVSDTGVDQDHPDIKDSLWRNPGEIPNNKIDDDRNGYVDDIIGWDFVMRRWWPKFPDSTPDDGHGHGTHVAGTIAATANNDEGVAGVCWNCKIMAIKGLDFRGSGRSSELAEGIKYAADNGARVINMSWGGFGTSSVVSNVLDYAYNLGVVLVASAGNANWNAGMFFPANHPKVVTVGAIDYKGDRPSFSNYGPKVDVLAPGVDVLSLRGKATDMYRDGTHIVDDKYYYASGTSMAAPHVSGAAGLILSKNNQLSPLEVRSILSSSSKPLRGIGREKFRSGVLDLDSALQYGESFPGVASIEFASLDLWDVDLFTGSKIDLTGTATAAGFKKYTIEWGSGVIPTSWSKRGISLAGSGKKEVRAGRLGTWKLPKGLKGGVYALRLTVYGDKIYRAYSPSIGISDKDLVWRRSINSHESIAYASSPLVVSDLNNDGREEVIYYQFISRARMLKIDVVNSEGKSLPGWPVDIKIPPRKKGGGSPRGASFSPQPAVGDIDGDGKKEVVIIASYSYPNHQDYRIYVLKYDGTLVMTAQSALKKTNYSPVDDYSVNLNPLLYDVNYDGRPEIVLVATDNYFEFGEQDKIPNWPYDKIIAIDGKEEIIVKEWSLSFPESYDSEWEVSVVGKLSIGDLNGDGRYELGMEYSGRRPTNKDWGRFEYSHGFMLINDQGEILNGWPMGVEDNKDLPSYGGIRILLKAVLGDVNGDSRSDVVWSYNFIKGESSPESGGKEVVSSYMYNYAWDYSRKTIWKKVFSYSVKRSAPKDFRQGRGLSGYGPPASRGLGDINGDGVPELVQLYRSYSGDIKDRKYNVYFNLTVLNGKDGSDLKNYPLTKTISVKGRAANFPDFIPLTDRAPTIADVNKDGRSDIIVPIYSYKEGVYKIAAFDYKGRLVKGWPKVLGVFDIVPHGSTRRPRGPVVGDLDKDGKLDILMASWFYIYRFGLPSSDTSKIDWGTESHDSYNTNWLEFKEGSGMVLSNNPPSAPATPSCSSSPSYGNNPPNNPQTPQCSASSDNNPPNTSGAPTCNAP